MRGFTLIELMVAVSIIAILSAVGVSAFSKAQVKARDTTRKNDLRQIQTALDLYYESNSKYPAGAGLEDATTCMSDADFSSKINPLLKITPKDPKTGKNYCYKATTDGKTYLISATLEETNIALVVSSDESYIAQKSDVVASRIITPVDISIPAPAPINRIDQSSCLIWINGTADSYQLNFERSTYRVVQDSSIVIKGLLPGRFKMKIAAAGPVSEVSGASGFTISDKYIEHVPNRVDGPFTIELESITNPDIKCHRNYTTIAPSCPSGIRGYAPIFVRVVRDNNLNLDDNWPMYHTKDVCSATNLPDAVLKRFTAFAGQVISSTKESLSSSTKPAVLGTSNDSYCVIDGVTQPDATACGYEDPPRVLGYCFSGICRFDTCGQNSDCIDNNACTTDEKCGGFKTSPQDGKSRGLCSSTQVPAFTVCAPSLNAPVSSATMLCSGGTASTCSMPYAVCTKASDSTGNCCGVTNIQIPDSCRACYSDQSGMKNNLDGKPGIRDVAVWIMDSCGKQYVAVTDNGGIARFSNMPGRTDYPISFEVPNGRSFNRAYSALINGFTGIAEFTCYGGRGCGFGTITALLRTVQSSNGNFTAEVGIGLK